MKEAFKHTMKELDEMDTWETWMEIEEDKKTNRKSGKNAGNHSGNKAGSKGKWLTFTGILLWIAVFLLGCSGEMPSFVEKFFLWNHAVSEDASADNVVSAQDIIKEEFSQPSEGIQSSEGVQSSESVQPSEGVQSSESQAAADVTETTEFSPIYVVRGLAYYGVSLDGLLKEDAMKVIRGKNELIRQIPLILQAEDRTGLTEKLTAEELTAEELTAEELTAEELTAEELTADELSAEKLTAEELGLIPDETVISEVLDHYCHPTSMEWRTAGGLKNLTVLDFCDQDALFEKVKAVVSEWDVPAVDAVFTYENGQIVLLSSEVSGMTYSAEDIFEELKDLVVSSEFPAAEKVTLNASADVVPAGLTADMAATYGLIGGYTTYFAGPRDQAGYNRLQNLIRSTSNVNGRVFAPGETISALQMYGPVDAENGYYPAGTFNAGMHVDEYGGGICQTTTTMYNAVLLAELEVLHRSNHSMLVNYVPASMDAMVYAKTGSDFRFRNSSTGYILLQAYVDVENCALTVNIIGHEDHPADHAIRFETEIIDYKTPEFETVVNLEAGLGWKNVEQKIQIVGEAGPSCEIWSRLWKITKEGGVETRTLVNANDHYNPGVATMAISPDAQLVMAKSDDYRTCYIQFYMYFLDGTRLDANPATWTEDQLVTFNENMNGEMTALGYEWPYKDAEFES